MTLMVRTHIPVSVWEAEGDDVVMTAFHLLQAEDEEDDPDPPTDEQIRQQWGV